MQPRTSLRNYVTPSILKDKIIWVTNLENYTLKIDLFVKIAIQKFRSKYQGARDVIFFKIDLFITIAPQKFHVKFNLRKFMKTCEN